MTFDLSKILAPFNELAVRMSEINAAYADAQAREYVEGTENDLRRRDVRIHGRRMGDSRQQD